MSKLDQFFRKQMDSAREPIGSPLDLWWIMRKRNNDPLQFQNIILIFSQEPLVLIFRDGNSDFFKFDEYEICLMHWKDIVEDYKDRHNGVALDWMGYYKGFVGGGKCYQLRIF